MFHHGFTLLQSPSAVRHSRFTSRTMLRKYCIHENGAPPHIARQVTALLQPHFVKERIISSVFLTAWPPRSSDSNPSDFWLGEFLNDHVYIGRMQSVPE